LIDAVSVTLLIILSIIFSTYFKLSIDASIALTIFLLVVFITLAKWEYRLAICLLGISGLFYLGVIEFEDFLIHTNMDIIIFLLGMMIIVGYLEENNYFTFLISKIIKFMHGSGFKTLAILMLLGAFFSAIVDEVTAILFMIAITLELVAIYDVDPYPFILAVTFSVIIGGTATLMGDPVAIIVAFEGGLTMNDFLMWATPITLLNLFILLLIITLFLRKDIKIMTRHMSTKSAEDVIETLTREKPNKVLFSTLVLIGVLALIILHDPLSNILSTLLSKRISPETFLLSSPLLFSSIILLMDWHSARAVLIHRVDWMTLLFFMLFFAIVGSLEVTGLLEDLLTYLIKVTGGSEVKLFLIITLLTGVLSLFVANVLTVATIAPIIKELMIKGFQVYPLWWGILFSSVFMALSTPVGTAASLVMLGLLDRHKIKRVSFSRWVKIGFPSALITTLTAVAIIFIRGFII